MFNKLQAKRRVARKIKLAVFAVWFGFAAIGAMPFSAQATVILNTDIIGVSQSVAPRPVLLGASGVVIDGLGIFTVEFVDGPSCIVIFGGCTEAANTFNFSNATDAVAAAQALLDQVIIDVIFPNRPNPNDGKFDTIANNILGCSSQFQCGVFIPFGIGQNSAGDSAVLVATALNFPLFPPGTGNPTDADDEAILGTIPDGSSSTSAGTFAVFNRTGDTSIIEVPEPGALALFGIGLMGLGFVRRRRVAVA